MVNFSRIMVLERGDRVRVFENYPAYIRITFNGYRIARHLYTKVISFAERILELEYQLPRFSCGGIFTIFHDPERIKEKLGDPDFTAALTQPGSHVLLIIYPEKRYNDGILMSPLGPVRLQDATEELSFLSRQG
jgi:hypothetical protein